jgi:hypothetical protein
MERGVVILGVDRLLRRAGRGTQFGMVIVVTKV